MGRVKEEKSSCRSDRRARNPAGEWQYCSEGTLLVRRGNPSAFFPLRTDAVPVFITLYISFSGARTGHVRADPRLVGLPTPAGHRAV
jgi:hypothetical protein